jgi:outer membrane protein assembly factor BamB
MPRRLSVWAVLISCACSAALAADRGKDWPQWYGPDRDNKSSETGLNTDWESKPAKLLWKMDGLGEGYASVAVVGNRLYTTGNLGDGQYVFAVDLDKRKIAWKTRITKAQADNGGYKGTRSTPTVDGNQLYAISSDGKLACLKSGNGKMVWEKDFAKDWQGRMMSGWGYAESPLVDDDRLICTPGGDNTFMAALDKNTGKEIWRTTGDGLGGAGYASIVVSEGAGVKQYVNLAGRAVVGVRASDGELLWKYEKINNGTANIPTPVVAGDYVFATTGYGGGAAVLKLIKTGNGVDAQEVWSTKELQNQLGGVILDGDYLYFGNGHGNGMPTCVEFGTGKVVWGGKLRGAGNGTAALTYADGHVVFRYQSGEVALIEATPDEYRLKGVFKPEVVIREAWSHPVVSHAKLYLREQGTLMCYDLK